MDIVNARSKRRYVFGSAVCLVLRQVQLFQAPHEDLVSSSTAASGHMSYRLKQPTNKYRQQTLVRTSMNGIQKAPPADAVHRHQPAAACQPGSASLLPRALSPLSVTQCQIGTIFT